jgi:hypothetical protein
MLPNAILTLPALGEPLEWAGDQSKHAGVKVMDSFLKAGKAAHRYDAQPGLGVLEEGPRTSIAATRQGFSDNVNAAKNRAGAELEPLVSAATGDVQRPVLNRIVDNAIDDKTAALNGPGGKPSGTIRLEELRGTFAPLTRAPGNASVQEIYAAKRNMDKNINWSRDIDPVEATANNANREIRSGLANQLYEAAPELKAPSQRYSNLAGAAKLAKDRTFDTNGSLFSPMKLLSGAASGMTAELATHNPVAAAASGIFGGLLPEVSKAPIVKTGLATGLFQAGKLASAAGGRLKTLQPFTFGKKLGDPSEGDYANAENSYNDQGQNQQSVSPYSGLYSKSDVTPEIIRPSDIARSRMGLGARGKGGILIRPLGALPAPPVTPPEATPYSWQPPTTTALPAVAPEQLRGSIGSASSVIPSTLLGDAFSAGPVTERPAALRQAQMGTLGSITPLRSFRSATGKSGHLTPPPKRRGDK